MFALGPLEESFPRTRASSVALSCDQSGHGEKSRPVSDQYPVRRFDRDFIALKASMHFEHRPSHRPEQAMVW